MSAFLVEWVAGTWGVLTESAPYFLLGLVLAGMVWLFLNERNLKRFLGRSRGQEVFRAALLGVPLPLCSCSVLPVASQLRNSGLSRGGTVSFLIATPESSIDSILLTYSLTDPVLTIARPIAAFLTAGVAGFGENIFEAESAKPIESAIQTTTPSCDCACEKVNPPTRTGIITSFGNGLRHAFVTLIGDLAPYLFWGYILAGLAGAVFGQSLGLTVLTGWWPYLLAIVIGVPMYVCATSSTPLAAVLLGAGFPPGAIMVFLMVGPATNVATIAVVRKILGFWPTVRYVVVIVVMALISGLVLDWIYTRLDINVSYKLIGHEHANNWLQVLSAILLAGLILWHSSRRMFKRLF